MKSPRLWILALVAVVAVGAAAVAFWPRSNTPTVEERARQIAVAVSEQDQETLIELLNYDVAATTLLADAAGSSVSLEPGGVVDQGDGSYMVTLTTASGDPLVVYLSYDNGSWGQAAVP